MRSMNWTEFRTVKDIEIDGLVLQAEVEIFLARDPAYGADADGNRGVDRTVIEDYRIEGIWDVDTGDDLTERCRDNPEVKCAIERGL